MPDGRIVSGSGDRTVRVWDLTIREGEPGQMIVLRGHEDFVTSLAVMQNGRIVSASNDKTVIAWNPFIRNGKRGYRRERLLVHKDADSDIETSHDEEIFETFTVIAEMPDGRFVLTIRSDNTVQVWNPALHKNQPGYLKELQMSTVIDESSRRKHYLVLKPNLVIMSDGRVVSGDSDTTIRMWSSEQYFREKVARTQDRRDYEMDGPGVYEILFP